MQLIVAALLTLLPLSFAVPHIPFAPIVEKRADSPTPRLAVYVQTFHTPDGQPLSLLPLLDNPTKITHVILAALHLQSDAGDIHLNDDPPNSAVFDQTWSEVKTLQQNGIKVLAMMGGAAQGSYQLLAGDDASVHLPNSVSLVLAERLSDFAVPIILPAAPQQRDPQLLARRSRPRY